MEELNVKEIFLVMMKENHDWEIFRDFDTYEEALGFISYHHKSWKFFKIEKWFVSKEF